MKRNHLSLRRKAGMLSAMAVGVLLVSSCAQDGFDDESWRSDVTNTQLESPAADDITIEASADGSQTIISWPVVHGAGGYLCSVVDVTEDDNPAVVSNMQDSIVDRCQIVVDRTEDHNYTFSIKTLGNEELGNTDAATSTTVDFDSYLATYGSIPANADLYEWFQQNPLPSESTGEELCFDLEPGGTYTLSQPVDFYNQIVTFRAKDNSNHAKLSLAASACFKTARGFKLKNIDVDCAGVTEPLVKLTDQLDPSIMDLIGTKGAYFIEDPVGFTGCNITDLGTSLISNNKIYYVVYNLVVDDCVIKLNKTDNSDAIVNFNGAGFASYSFQNSTIWESGTNTGYFFSQYGGRPKDITSDGTLKQSMVFRNCTLYGVSYNKKFSNQRDKGQTWNEYIVTNSIIVDCGTNKFLNGLLEQASANPHTEYANNTYFYDGVDVSAANTGSDGYDNSGSMITENPGFADPTNGDFTVSGSAQISLGTGDPRWLPTNE